MMKDYELEDAIRSYIEFIAEDYDKRTNTPSRDADIGDRMTREFREGLEYQAGKKYVKIIFNSGGRSVHSFVVINDDPKTGFKRGDVLKAASWKAPALNHARGNVLTGDYNVNWTGANYLK